MSLAGDLFASLDAPGELELFMGRSQSVDVEIEGGRITSAGRTTRMGGAIRVLHDGKLGFAYFTSPDDAKDALQQALATMQAVQGEFAFADPESLPPQPDVYDAKLATLDIDRHVQEAEALLHAAQEAAPKANITGGGVGCQVGESALVNSRGVHVSDRSTHHSLGAALVLPDGNANVSSWYSDDTHLDRLRPAEVGAEAARRTLALANPTALESTGNLAVVFRPEAISELLGGVMGQALDGDEALRGRSMWKDHIGKTVANEGLQLLDDPQHQGGVGLTNWDGEGRAARKVALIESGELQQFIFNGRDAARHGVQSTGHAQRDSSTSPPGTGFHHLVLQHDETMPEEELASDLVIESVLGAHTANAATGDFSITSPNVWRRVDGQLEPVKEVAIGGNMGAWLRNLDAVSSEVRNLGGAAMPSVRIQDVAVSV